MVKVPCQEIVWDVLPAMQAALAAELVSRGVSQVGVAKALAIAPSAVSQYLSGKRGYRVVFDEDVKVVIGELADKINGECLSEEELGREFCVICRKLRLNPGCDGVGL